MPAANVAMGVPVPDQPVPMGAAVSADDLVREARKQIAESAAAAEERVRREAHRAGDFEREALQRAGYAAQARMLSAIDAAVTASIDKRLPNALAAHIASSEGVRRISQDVEAQVERSARDVVKRIATYEVATRSLSSAIEERCVARIDERSSRVFWVGGLLGATAGAAAGVAAALLLRPR